jgi:NADH-quinone oxidoreductase subunit N
MINIITLNSHIPEVFLSFSILGQLIFGSFTAHSIKFRFPIILRETSTIFLQVSIILVLLYAIEFLANYNSVIFIGNNGVYLSKLILSIISFFLVILIEESLKIQKLNQSEYYFFYMLSLLALLLMIESNDLMFFYLTMETQSLCFYILASANRTNIFSIEAGLKYFIAGSFFSAIYLLGVSLIYGALGTINLGEISSILHFDLNLYSRELFLVVVFAVILVTSTILFKFAVVPFHFWMPDVYEGSPISSTMVFSILPKFSLIYFFIKWLNALGQLQEIIRPGLILFGVASTVLGTLYAVKQLRTKRMILYSSIAQIGFIIVGLALTTNTGYSVVLFYTIFYIVTSLLIWGNIILIYCSQLELNFIESSNLNPLYISTFSDIITYTSLWTFVYSIIFFSIGGIPPFVGFLSKFLILESLVMDGYFYTAIVLIAISSVSLFYYIRILKIAFFETSTQSYVYSDYQKQILKTNNLYIIHFLFMLLLISIVFFFFFPNIFVLVTKYIVHVSFLI